MTTALLRQRWDFIFFTGSEHVGRIVLRAAAEHLTPCVLELGGKSPVYVDRTADLVLAAKRIMWGKILNAGQVCIAPDYVLVHKDVEKAFVTAAVAAVKEFLGANPQNSTTSLPSPSLSLPLRHFRHRIFILNFKC